VKSNQMNKSFDRKGCLEKVHQELDASLHHQHNGYC